MVIVGAALAGLTTAESLREEGYDGAITLIGSEPHLPYSRPPLSKRVLAGDWEDQRTTLREEQQITDLEVTLLRGRTATDVDLPGRSVLVDGERVHFEYLVAASGVRARTLDNPRDLHGVHVLRTIDDARHLRRALVTAPRIAIIGAGVLGCEIASTLVDAGHQVTLIGRTTHPRFDATGGHISTRIARILAEHKVDLRMGVQVMALEGDAAVSSVILSDGTRVETDLVVSAIGSVPSVEWLRTTEIDLTDGVLCDAHGLAAPNIYAVGDVARWWNPVAGIARRVEHQSTAIEQARAVGKLIATGETSGPIVPFFWAELFHERILVHGRLMADIRPTILAGDPHTGGFVVGTICEGQETGIIGWNLPREFRRERARMLESVPELVTSGRERA